MSCLDEDRFGFSYLSILFKYFDKNDKFIKTIVTPGFISDDILLKCLKSNKIAIDDYNFI